MGKKTYKKRKSKSTNDCAICFQEKPGKSVACDQCNQWYHFGCVNIVSIGKKDPYICPNCTEKEESTSTISEKPSSTVQKNVSRKSVDQRNIDPRIKNVKSSQIQKQTPATEDIRQSEQSFRATSLPHTIATYTLSRCQLQLKQIEEERELERRYIQKKYQILMEGCSDDQRTKLTDRSQYTKEWIDNRGYVSIWNDDAEKDDFLKRLKENRTEPTIPSKATESQTLNLKDFKNETHSQHQEYQQKENLSPQLSMHSIRIKPIQIPILSHKKGNVKPLTGRVLTREQIASRHVVPKDLPLFHGHPEDWDTFIKRYMNSTELCGFSDAENLERLDKCLKGTAREAVKSLLLDVKSVPDILDTLKMLFGRPELIIKSLLTEIRKQPAPKPDNLKSMIEFALAVKNLSATMERKGMRQYLSNPVLIQELVERLPTVHKISWAQHCMYIPDDQVNISTISDWLQRLMKALVKVTELVVPKIGDKKPDKKSSKTGQEHINIHQNQNYQSSKTQCSQVESVKSENITKTKDKSPNINSCFICNQKCSNISECVMFKSFKPDQRWQEIYRHKICRFCLRRHRGYCKFAKECGVNGCKYKHHSLLHDEQKHSKNLSINKDGSTTETVTKLTGTTHNVHNCLIPNVLLRIVPVILHYNQRSLNDFAYIDEGSTGTLMEKDLAYELDLKGIPEQLCLLWTGDVHRIEENSERVNLEISGRNEFSCRYRITGVRTVKNLNLPIQSVDREELFKKFPYLHGTPLIDYENIRPRILIGSNNARLCSQLELIERDEYEPIASRSRIGWSLHGPTCKPNDNNRKDFNQHHFSICVHEPETNEKLFSLVKEHFAIENFGVQINNALNLNSKEDERALDILKNTTKRIEGGFETGLLWRYDNFELPESYQMAKRRLICLENKNPKIVPIINETIKDYMAKGYVTKLTNQELLEDHKHKWYLPIFSVTYPKKPDKHRTVFDAAAKANGISLNSMLLKGPDQLCSLIDILRRFREKKIAICGDIREMFHQVKVRDQDRQVQRFLWRNGDLTKKPEVYVLNVMTFGATCSPSSAQYIKNLNAAEFQDQYPRAAQAIIQNHYVDDMMEGEDSEEKAIQLVKDVQTIHARGGFEMRKFLSNSRMVLETLGVSQKDESKNLAIDLTPNTERVLGMFWNMELDCFTFSTKFTKINPEVASGQRYPTKREVLKTLASIYDPLGLLSHYLILLKILLQKLWRSKIEWDQQISDVNQKVDWDRWLKLLPSVEDVRIPRLLSPKLTSTTLSSVELHIFTDGSENAFSAVGYLRLEDDSGVECVLIGSKSRVAPIKYLSIPRLELQGGVLGIRLRNSISAAQTFKIDRTYFWTDSENLISWIRSDHRKYHQFVAYRIGEILENSDMGQWRWISTKDNVADEATKWSKTPTFEQNSRWFQGPKFLYLPVSEWPKQKSSLPIETNEEMKIHFVHAALVIPQLINPERFSDWNRMVRALAYVIRYVKILRSRIKLEKINSLTLTRDELNKSRNLIFRQSQYDGYLNEMITLQRNQNLPSERQIAIRKRSVLYKCSPYLDEFGVIRIKGRIDAANNISFDTKRPIILPKKQKITHLLVACYHRIYYHHNHETAVNEIRQRFYIPKLRVVLKTIRKDCQMCKVRNAQPAAPEMGNLPIARLAVGFKAFTYIGIDFFGPIKIVDGRRLCKRWGVLITCLTVRAIHIEVAHKLNTESCIKCIENFIYIRGSVKEIFSDCGTNFKGMDNALTRAIKDLDPKSMAEKFNSFYTQWNFNPPEAQYMGGAWERLIRNVKTSLYSIMPTRNPTDEMLRNLLMGVVNVVNSRPLTFIPLDSDEDEALTPNHFIFGSSNGMKPPGEFNADGAYLKSQWKEVQRLTNLFWQRFVKEYLPVLTRRTKWFQQVSPLQPGDIVLIIDKDAPRNTYVRARVLNVRVGSNGQVRDVVVQKGNEAKTILRRPATRLAKLDIGQVAESKGLADDQRVSQTGGSVTNGQHCDK